MSDMSDREFNYMDNEPEVCAGCGVAIEDDGYMDDKGDILCSDCVASNLQETLDVRHTVEIAGFDDCGNLLLMVN